MAWISERKDTLSTLFAAVALLLYAKDPQRVGGAAADHHATGTPQK